MQNKIFQFGNHKVRVVIAENNEPMFVAKEIAEILGYQSTQTMTRRLDEDEKDMQILHTLGGSQKITLITESGLYSSILGSNKPEAKSFKKWVTGEVLPSIRKHGMYANQQTIEEMLTSPDFAIKTLEALKEEREAKNRLAYEKQLLEGEIQKAVPKVQYYEEVLQSNSEININQIAKELGMSAICLNRKLQEMKVQYKQNDQWLLYAKYQNQGYTQTETYPYKGTDGTIKTSIRTVWTEKGRQFIHSVLKQKQLI
jgi:prophage antirepressor-like protein